MLEKKGWGRGARPVCLTFFSTKKKAPGVGLAPFAPPFFYSMGRTSIDIGMRLEYSIHVAIGIGVPSIEVLTLELWH